MVSWRDALKVIPAVMLLFAISCGTTSNTETVSTTESHETGTTEVTPSSEPPATMASTQNGETTEPTSASTTSKTTASYSENGIFFPKQKSPRGAVMSTRGRGQLVLSDKGCLRLKTVEGRRGSLLIWPPDYSLNTQGNRVRILNKSGQVAAMVGDYVEVGGGGLSSLNVEMIPEDLRQELPERCSPPYHAVGEEVRVVQE